MGIHIATILLVDRAAFKRLNACLLRRMSALSAPAEPAGTEAQAQQKLYLKFHSADLTAAIRAASQKAIEENTSDVVLFVGLHMQGQAGVPGLPNMPVRAHRFDKVAASRDLEQAIREAVQWVSARRCTLPVAAVGARLVESCAPQTVAAPVAAAHSAPPTEAMPPPAEAAPPAPPPAPPPAAEAAPLPACEASAAASLYASALEKAQPAASAATLVCAPETGAALPSVAPGDVLESRPRAEYRWRSSQPRKAASKAAPARRPSSASLEGRAQPRPSSARPASASASARPEHGALSRPALTERPATACNSRTLALSHQPRYATHAVDVASDGDSTSRRSSAGLLAAAAAAIRVRPDRPSQCTGAESRPFSVFFPCHF